MSEDDNAYIEPHILEKFDIIKELGEGAYGIVWKATDKATGEIVALKKIFKAFQNSTDAQRTYREVMLLRALQNESIIRLFDVFPSQNEADLYLVFEFMDSDLHNANASNILEEEHKQYIVYQLFEGFTFYSFFWYRSS